MKSLDSYTDEKISELLNENGAFFAFNDRQFNEQASPEKLYSSVSWLPGLCIPNENCEAVINGLERIHDEGIRQQVSQHSADEIIQYHYFNYECQISYDNTDALNALEPYRVKFPEIFTDEQIRKSFKAAWDKAVENDWF